MVITTDFDTFIERCVENGAKIIRSDCLSDDIMGLIGEEIQKLKQTKKNKEKFNIVMREVYSISYDRQDNLEEMMNEVIYPTIQEHEGSLDMPGSRIFFCDNGAQGYHYTKDLILTYKSYINCYNDIDGFNEWELSTNTADM